MNNACRAYQSKYTNTLRIVFVYLSISIISRMSVNLSSTYRLNLPQFASTQSIEELKRWVVNENNYFELR